MNSFIKIILGLILFSITGCLSPEEAPTEAEDTMHNARKHDNAGHTSLEEKTAWSASGELLAGVPINPVTGAAAGVSLQATFTESSTYTVQLFIGPGPALGTFSTAEFIRARAEVTWTIEGGYVRRLIDCVNGSSISGVGQSVKVRIYDESNYSQLHTPFKYQVTATVAKGTRSSVQQPPVFTSDLLTLGPDATSGLIMIPQNAGVISVMVVGGPTSPIASPNTVTEFSQLVAQQTPIGNGLKFYDPRDYDWVPVSPGADRLLIYKAVGTPNMNYTAIFGIDG